MECYISKYRHMYAFTENFITNEVSQKWEVFLSDQFSTTYQAYQKNTQKNVHFPH